MASSGSAVGDCGSSLKSIDNRIQKMMQHHRCASSRLHIPHINHRIFALILISHPRSFGPDHGPHPYQSTLPPFSHRFHHPSDIRMAQTFPPSMLTFPSIDFPLSSHLRCSRLGSHAQSHAFFCRQRSIHWPRLEHFIFVGARLGLRFEPAPQLLCLLGPYAVSEIG